MRFKRLLVPSIVLTLAVGSLQAQSTPTTYVSPRLMTGFGTAAAMGGGQIFVSRTGLSPLMPLLPSESGGIHVYAGDGGSLRHQAVLTPEQSEVGDGFGEAVATDGQVLIGGVSRYMDARGAAVIFERVNGTWRQTAMLTARQGSTNDSLGRAVAVLGDMAFVGAPGRNSRVGAVYVFRRDGGAWAQAARLDGSPESEGRFGAAIAVQGTRLVVGAPTENRRGAVHVFRQDGTRWTRDTVLIGPDSIGPGFGARVALAGETAIAASPTANGGTGAVFPYRMDGSGAWRPEGRLTAPTPTPVGLFGWSVALDGVDALLIGAVGPPQGGTGAVHVFRRQASGSWTSAQQLAPEGISPGAFFGASVAVSGDRAVVGALGTDFGQGTGFVFSRRSGSWGFERALIDEGGLAASITGGEIECTSGVAQGFDCADVDLVAFLPVSALGGERGILVNDLWGWTDPQTGREYVIMGRFDGTVFVDITNPTNPRVLGELPKTEGSTGNLWRDMKVYRNHAFIVADGAGAHGVQVFDLTRLRDASGGPVVFDETAHYDGIHSAHNIVINEESGFAFTVGNSGGGNTCGGGFHMIDVRDPVNPTFAGCYSDPATGNAGTGYTHDGQCVTYHGPDADYQGRELCFAASETALGIGDVTDKENPTPIASAAYPNVAYAHQGWLTEDHRYFFLNDELDELGGNVSHTRTLVWDVTDLDDPVLVTEHLAETRATDHNLYIRGDLMYQSNYVSGLRILDISDVANPREVAYFDTVPMGEEVPGFAGSWSNYPFFESGVIAVTSMREGLFLLKKKDQVLVP